MNLRIRKTKWCFWVFGSIFVTVWSGMGETGGAIQGLFALAIDADYGLMQTVPLWKHVAWGVATSLSRVLLLPQSGSAYICSRKVPMV